MGFAGAMVVAMAVDALLGWPSWLFARIGHPVTWLGRLIGAIDRGWNRGSDPPALRRAAGVAGSLLVIAFSVAIGCALQALLSSSWIQIVLVGILAWPLVALRSLHDHVAAVANPLLAGDIAAARDAVSRIVGRDPAALDEAGIARAAIESLAENASDGIVAPVFWGALFGLPGILGYKAINTLDSMIGHRNERHEAFGWAAARIDDVANFIPARLTGFVFVLLAPRRSEALSCMTRDARRHRSPNAGWPEAAMAGALGVRLSGPRIYHGSATDEPWLNEGARDPRAADIAEALTVYRRAMVLLAGTLAILAFA
ncbi:MULTISPECIES: adenosylcobinamide-phosphate synthase CbiB [Bradyrhizobium]|uniref:Cobalamin biosynthesis protein CobD n=1 Tax=Bradyrhizobium ottawaense TaxID=931866 RepID=A0ABV4FYD8_9BRAD|nr:MULTISPECIES: adenosylcobinamide-phosphate synthase CbiB [Bradyrhizobium]MDA9418168.1 cobalamin biosynthesis protein CobD [Bradyrhizobium sp. CCBAU 25360]MDA9480392.1 cobalamin biosynthesis protein CobD [Bradyrhizobium sp. CCBAU 65884]MDA9485060.1 cobalamin biosynthesis protein CobD [Bradyrhizobium sp. CCBAU 11445]WLB48867.1 adenosylcobinamide-phosphate synthase CbiB [Bradyrhizobium ottawaense]WQN86187.1 adenosylcobinamide-phosphate synthase CbiB [Bradyrhizobium ottawaense]